MKKKKKLSYEEETKLRSEIAAGQDATDLLAFPGFVKLIKNIEVGCDKLLLELRYTETEAFSFYSIKKEALKDIVNNLKVLEAKGKDAEEVLAGDPPRKRGLL